MANIACNLSLVILIHIKSRTRWCPPSYRLVYKIHYRNLFVIFPIHPNVNQVYHVMCVNLAMGHHRSAPHSERHRAACRFLPRCATGSAIAWRPKCRSPGWETQDQIDGLGPVSAKSSHGSMKHPINWALIWFDIMNIYHKILKFLQ